MTLTLEQRKCPATLIKIVCDIMKRDGKVELDCGHYAILGHTEQELTVEETEPHQFIVICKNCATRQGDETCAFILGEEDVVERDPEEDTPEEPIGCRC
jgi:hypothetical protein